MLFCVVLTATFTYYSLRNYTIFPFSLSGCSLAGHYHKHNDTDPAKPTKLWAYYTPYRASQSYFPPPSTCTLTQVNILQRHGARYPTPELGEEMVKSLNKLKNAERFEDPRLDFVRDYNWRLGADDLVKFGAAELAEAGALQFSRYKSLISEHAIPFIRASGEQRVVDSAGNWTKGFAAASKGKFAPKIDLIIPEEHVNSTLRDNHCPNLGKPDPFVSKWMSLSFPSITARLNAAAPGANVSNKDVYHLMMFCPFESVAHGFTKHHHKVKHRRVEDNWGLKESPWCDVFTDEEWKIYEYAGDLDKYYGTGYGQEYAPSLGTGYISELLSRLTSNSSYLAPGSQINSTLDSNPTTFPLDPATTRVFADFSHDHNMVAIYSTLGLYPHSRENPLDATEMDDTREYVSGRLIPFAARMVVEKMDCSLLSSSNDGGASREEFVRILVNDAVQPLDNCAAGSDYGKLGMCRLDEFIGTQMYVTSGRARAEWEECFRKDE